MTRARSLASLAVALALALALPGHAAVPLPTYRVEGAALASEPPWPTTAQALTITSTAPEDTGATVLIRGLDQPRNWLETTGTVGGSTAAAVYRLNRVYWEGPEPGPVGTVTVSHPEVGALVTISPGKPSAFFAFFSVGQGRANVVLARTTGTVTRVMHRRGQAPQSSAEVAVDGAAPGIGDFWVEGSGFVQFDLEAR